jgi:putative spermidine/putrescine transport system substrate-binding protein/spermidine/putrescine transport system substrate-binding protein
MSAFDYRLSRRRFLQASAFAGAAVGLGGISAACNLAGQQGGTFNWMTWSDHYYDDQLKAIEGSDKITANITELAGNAEGFAKLKEVKGQLDMISGDALWVPAYHDEGLIDPFNLSDLKVSSQLYPLAREFEIWTVPGGYLGYPFGWSPILIFYNPKFVDPAPDSWEVILDPKYKGRVVVENQPEEITAYMGKAAGVEDPYNMNDEQLATVKGLLERLKPNILRFAQQATDTVNAMISEEAYLVTGNLGNEDRVKDGGGPEIKGFIPKEGTVGWMDAEMTVSGGANRSLLFPFLEKAEQAEHMAENFIRYGRPLFNEQAYKILTDKGEKDRADRYLYNKPETVETMTLKGPGLSTEKSIQLFNEVFGA